MDEIATRVSEVPRDNYCVTTRGLNVKRVHVLDYNVGNVLTTGSLSVHRVLIFLVFNPSNIFKANGRSVECVTYVTYYAYVQVPDGRVLVAHCGSVFGNFQINEVVKGEFRFRCILVPSGAVTIPFRSIFVPGSPQVQDACVDDYAYYDHAILTTRGVYVYSDSPIFNASYPEEGAFYLYVYPRYRDVFYRYLDHVAGDKDAFTITLNVTTSNSNFIVEGTDEVTGNGDFVCTTSPVFCEKNYRDPCDRQVVSNDLDTDPSYHIVLVATSN